MNVQDSELASLWDKYKRLARKIAMRFTTPHYELDDLLQECFIIFMAAVKDYDPDSGYTLVTHLGNRFKWGLYRLIYDGKGERRIKDTCILDEPFDAEDDGSATMADMIPDPAAEFENRSVDKLTRGEVWELARHELAAFDRANSAEHPGRLYDIIEAYYRNNISMKELARRLGVSFQLVQQEQRKAIVQLRKSRRLQFLSDDVISQSITRTGLGSFQRSGTSSVEWAVLEMERLQMEQQEWRQEMLVKFGIDVDKLYKEHKNASCAAP